MKPPLTPTLFGMSLLLACGVATAHETWLMPSSFNATAGQEVTFTVTSGMRFPAAGNGIKPERLAQAGLRVATREGALIPARLAGQSLAFKPVMPGSGPALAWLTLKPKDIVLSDAKVAEYLDEIDAAAQVRQAWQSQKGKHPWRETYTKHAKTYVAVEGDASDTSWSKPVGLGFEIVPLSNPLIAASGQTFKAQLVASASARPVLGVPVGLVVKGERRPVFRTTDANGQVSFTLQRCGEAMLYAVHLRQASDGVESAPSWVSDFTTMTFNICPQRQMTKR